MTEKMFFWKNLFGFRSHPLRIVGLFLLVCVIVMSQQYWEGPNQQPARTFMNDRGAPLQDDETRHNLGLPDIRLNRVKEQQISEIKMDSSLLKNSKVSTPRKSPKLPVDAASGIRNWIVLTTINPPTDAVKSLATLKGWQLLVIGDTKTPKDWKWPGVIFLDYDAQLELGYSILEHIPTKHYARKNIGYLYAIQHGAEMIYETDDDNVPWPKLDLSSYVAESLYTGVKVNSHGAYNHHAHFGQSSTWPRGFPLATVSANPPREYFVETMVTPAVQQGLVNGDPDMDAIFRLTRKQKDINLNITFDPTAPPLVLPHKSITPYNSQNTMFRYNAFWTLALPISVAFRVTDIWRSYWAQPLLWLIGERVMYLPPNAFQERNAHNYVKDAIDEFQMYRQSDDIVNYLVEWKCEKSELAACAVQLAQDMVENKFWGGKDAAFIEAWMNDLQAIGYNMPKIVTGSSSTGNNKVLFYPVEQKTSMPNSQKNQKLEPDDTTLILEETLLLNCPSSTTSSKSLIPLVPFFSNLLLIIFIQKGKSNTIPMLELKYKPHFPSIIYCGLDSDGKRNAEEKHSYIPIRDLGPNGYNTVLTKCFETALKMNYGVKGYVFIRSEVILDVRRLSSLDQTSIWYPESHAGVRRLTGIETGKDSFEKCTAQLQTQINLDVKYQQVAQFPLFYIPKSYVTQTLKGYLLNGKVMDNILLPWLMTCSGGNQNPVELKSNFQQSHFQLEKDLDKIFKTTNMLCDVILPKFVWPKFYHAANTPHSLI